MATRGLHSVQGHCYRLDSQQSSVLFESTHWIQNCITNGLHMMLTNGSPPKITNMAPTCGLFGSQQWPDDNVGASDNNARNTMSNDNRVRQSTNQFHPPPPRYSYPPSQPPFQGAPQFYHQAPSNMIASWRESCGATKGYPSYGLAWQASDSPPAGYDVPQMFPPQQFTGYGPLSPGVPRVPPALPSNNVVIRPTSFAHIAPGQLAGAPGWHPIGLTMKRL